MRIEGRGLVPDRIWPAVRQPNDVAVNEATDQVFVAGTDDDQLQLIDPGTRGAAASLSSAPRLRRRPADQTRRQPLVSSGGVLPGPIWAFSAASS